MSFGQTNSFEGIMALRSVERFVEMLPEGSSVCPPLPRDGVSVA
jgi:hypothetical protein